MEKLLKKRGKALAIDVMASAVVTAAVEPLLRKKVKQEWVHALVTPTVVFWGLEYIQLKTCGQTVGHKISGIKIENEDGGELTGEQILKRVAHRDSIMTLQWFKERGQDMGAQMPHDRYAHTVVRELDK
ncbi:RDD family protein [Planococcus maritimus]|nr:RDD family protein [Planococcus sp. SK3692]MDE4085401.1 RDD family protein [Planococcus maritimus]